MALIPKRACNQPACRGYAERNGYCIPHWKKKQKQYDKDRGSSSKRGYDHRWTKIRNLYWTHNPLCERCEAEGIVKQTEIIHHKDRNPKNNKMDNLEALCRNCHNDEHKEERW